MRVSLSQVAELTGRNWRTIKRRIDAAGCKPVGRNPRNTGDVYESSEVLAAVYQDKEAAEKLDGFAEKARADKERADQLALANALTRGDLARVSVIERELAGFMADLRANLLALPAKVAPSLEGLNIAERNQRIADSIHECLGELADYRPGARGDDSLEDAPPFGEDTPAAARVNGGGMGGRGASPKPRKRRRAGTMAD